MTPVLNESEVLYENLNCSFTKLFVSKIFANQLNLTIANSFCRLTTPTNESLLEHVLKMSIENKQCVCVCFHLQILIKRI